jgi:outer membrane protein OmpA-like peptidoglycan-associated protein
LKGYAILELKNPNRCDALAKIVSHAAFLVDREPSPAQSMIDDLQLVLIGDGLMFGRSSGQYFAGHAQGARGFKPEMRDEWNQIQHAMAGIVIGYRYIRPVQWYVRFQEDEPQDLELYDATFPLGRGLNDSNYKQLAHKLRHAIGDQSCRSTGEEDSKPLIAIRTSAGEDPKRIVIQAALFDFDSDQLKPEAEPILMQAFHVLFLAKRRHVTLEGHTDSVGPPAYNMELSLRRAKAVKEWFGRSNFPEAATFEVKGFGESRPIAPNKSRAGRRKNRRVEIVYQ